MIENLLLDAGGVMVYPRLGDWNIPFGAAALLGEKARDLATAKYLAAHRQAAHWLDESRRLPTLEDERRVRRGYIREMSGLMGWDLTDDVIDRLGDDFTENPNRYGAFNDVLPWLGRWKPRYRLAVVSDCMPSLPVYLERWGALPLLDAAVYSFQVGAVKPDRRMYAAALEALNAAPETCLFVDDRASNLEGAAALGIHAAQMARSETMPDVLWDGPVVHSFAELNALVEAMNAR